ncbi:MAG TPA: tetratricopeptide repeat protein [Syntrophales bacterium]|nr:tetratricopeptide repeat protein [Syntrophales bacterium]HQN77640.1 tetratricopeptide repeat protein [Syntrophales bacterium]
MKPDNRRHGFLLRPVFLSLVLLIGIFGHSMKSFAGEETEKKYAVQVASFRTVEKAEEEAQRFRKAGFSACWREVSLRTKGIWRRVYAGCSDTRKEAKEQLAEMKRKKMVRYAAVVKLPAAPADAAAPAETKRPAETQRPAEGETRVAGAVPKPSVRDRGPSRETAAPETVPPEPAVSPAEDAPAPPEKKAAIDFIPEPDILPAPPRDEEDDSIPIPPVPFTVSQEKWEDAEMIPEPLPGVPHGSDCREILPVLKKAAGESRPGAPGRERLFRDCADCSWQLGMQGDSLMLLEAVDTYRRVLWIDPKGGGHEDEIRFRIARSYEMLDFYHEAQGSYENLLVLCPSSPLVPEALFRMGRMLFKGGKYQEAINALVAYLKKQPGGPWAKEAYFTAGVACLRLGKPYHAEIWFRDGMKAWSRYQDIPEGILFALGEHFIKRKKYDDALNVLTQYVSIHPGGKGVNEALYRLGTVLYEKGQPERAVFLFGSVLERNPESNAAEESLLMLARIAWENPGLKIQRIQKGGDALFDPIHALNGVHERHRTDPLGERALFFKALCLQRMERWEEMTDTCLALQNGWGSGGYRDKVLPLLRSGADRLVAKYSGEGDDVAVADLYFRVYGKGLVLPAEFATCCKIGESLGRIGDSRTALEVFETAMKMAGNEEDRFGALSSIVDLECLDGGTERALQRLSRFLAEGEKGNKTAFASRVREKMAEVHFRKGDGETALFLMRPLLDEPSWKPADPVSAHFLLGRTLHEAGDWHGAASHYDRVLEACADRGDCDGDWIRRVMRDRGECLYRDRNYEKGIVSYEDAMKEEHLRERKLWTLYRVGQGHAFSGEPGKSQRTLNELKEAGEDEFWNRLADWWLYDHQWTVANGRYVDR